MTWSPDLSPGFESDKCRHRVTPYLNGRGLDVGCGDKKIVETAIGIDYQGGAADLRLDVSEPNHLDLFTDSLFDYVFSSHCLQDLIDTKGTLGEWWRVLRAGGYLVLYGPDPDYYPRVGTPGCNPHHKHDLYWQDVWEIVKGFEGAELVSATRHNESNEYSWQLVIRKKIARRFRPLSTIKTRMFSRKKPVNGRKKCLVIRYGALGDTVWMTPVLRRLHKDGYHVTYNTTEYSAQVLKECPWVDEFMLQPKDAVADEDLKEYWARLKEEGHFDRVINMSGSIEANLLKQEGTPEFDWSHAQRHRHCNKNYQDTTMEWAGYPDCKGERPELHFTDSEHFMIRRYLSGLGDRFIILWSMSGSSFHKTWPWTEFVVGELYKQHPKDVAVITVGDELCQMIEPHTPISIPKAGHLPVRGSMLMTKYVDLVVGPETGILNAAACYDTPKVIFLSHSSVENLTKYWTNTTALTPHGCDCYPCHRLIYQNSCPKGKIAGSPLCAENVTPEMVYRAIEKYYQSWKKGERNVPTEVRPPKALRRLRRNDASRSGNVRGTRRRAV